MEVTGSINWLEQILFSISAMAIVFGVLVLLMLMINAMSIIFKEKKKVKQEVSAVEVQETEVEEYEEESDDCEVVAAIMAALSASLNVPTDKLMIKKIKRIDRSSNWRN